MRFPTTKSVKVTTKEFVPLIKQLVATIENHLAYVDDEDTEQIFADLVCNGIQKHEMLTVTAVAHMLNMTDMNNMYLAPVITAMFELVPVLKHYWKITKVNVQSIHIMKLDNVDVKILFDNMVKTTNNPSPTPSKVVQTTMTQHLAPGLTDDDTLNADLSTPIATSNNTSPIDAKSPSDYIETRGSDDFIKPKKTVPVTIIKSMVTEPSNRSANAFEILNRPR